MDNFKEAVRHYEEQLCQVELALKDATDLEREGLISLRNDLQELIQLTNDDANDKATAGPSQATTKKNCTNTIDDEFELFKTEMAKLEEPTNSSANIESAVEPTNSLEEELKALEGTKCRAPHGSSWGGSGYHNAMVCSIHKRSDLISSLDDIMIRVLFINPTHKEMLPCPYFLDGSCKFSEEQCHFSHGELILFGNLQEYKEPDYSNLRQGSRVLAKQKNNLWHRAVILRCPCDSEEEYQVKFEASGNVIEVKIHDVLPLDDAGLQMSDSSDDSDYEEEVKKFNNEELVHKSLLTLNHEDKLGGWEQHTRGMGSKLMAQMGYIHGTGLGKRSDGRVEPVEATVLPAGKSLDHCMTLRENSGGDKDLFTVERKIQKQKKKLELQRQKEYLREKNREKNDVFNFMNTTLGDKKLNPEPSSSSIHKELKKESNKNLRIASYQIGEDIAKLEKEATKLKNNLRQFGQGSVPYNNIASKYHQNQLQITKLKASEKRIAAEENQRKFKAKLIEF